jgi:hypothetical protein
MGGRHDPLAVLRLIYQMFSTFLGWIALRLQSETPRRSRYWSCALARLAPTNAGRLVNSASLGR